MIFVFFTILATNAKKIPPKMGQNYIIPVS